MSTAGIWAAASVALATLFAILLVRDFRRQRLDLGPLSIAWTTTPVRYGLVLLFEVACTIIFALIALIFAMLPPDCQVEHPCIVTLQANPQ